MGCPVSGVEGLGCLGRDPLGPFGSSVIPHWGALITLPSLLSSGSLGVMPLMFQPRGGAALLTSGANRSRTAASDHTLSVTLTSHVNLILGSPPTRGKGPQNRHPECCCVLAQACRTPCMCVSVQ